MSGIVHKEERELPCQLTNEELAEASMKLAAKTMEINELEERKKSIASDYKAKIDAMSAENNVLARKVNSKSEHRKVVCIWEFDWANGKKSLFRTDTGEKIAEDFIKDYENQRHFEDLKAEQEQAGKTVQGEPVVETPADPAPGLPAPQMLIEGEKD